MRLGAGEKALASWHEAHHVEEEIAAQQQSDEYKVRMLLAASDEHDEWIAASAAAIAKHGLAAAAGVALAIEAAAGPLTTEAISGRRAELPWPGDIVGACDWVRELTRDLPHAHRAAERVVRLLGYQSVGRDITNRKRADRALRESEMRFRAIVEDQMEFISRCSPDYCFTFINEAYVRQLGRGRDQIIGSSVLDLMTVEQRADDEECTEEALATREPGGALNPAG